MNYYVSSEKSKIQFPIVKRLMEQSYWAKDRSEQIITETIKNSLCYGAYLEDGRQIAFARVITDYVTSYYLCDVVVDEAYRGVGVGTTLIREIVEDSRLRGLRGILATGYAQSLYRKFGFECGGERLMERRPK